MGFLLSIVVSIAISAIAYALAPKPKVPKPGAAQDMEVPTAEAGRPIPVIFGEGTIKSPNVLYYTEVNTQEYKVKA